MEIAAIRILAGPLTDDEIGVPAACVEPLERKDTMNVIMDLPADNPVVQTAALSDLFFNYEHPTRDRLYQRHGTPTKNARAVISEEDERAALLADATAFAETLRLATGVILDPPALADDFLARL